MDKVTLSCGVYGDTASVFSTEIARNADVAALREVINQQRFAHQQCTFPACALTLLLARKKARENGDGTWLKHDHDTESVYSETLIQRIRNCTHRGHWKMKPVWDRTSSLWRGDIHILVKLPEAASRSVLRAPPDLQELIQAAFHKVLDERKQKRSAYALSDLNAELARRIVLKMRLDEEHLDLDEPANTSIAGYSWISQVPSAMCVSERVV